MTLCAKATLLLLLFGFACAAQVSEPTPTERKLMERINELEQRLASLEAKFNSPAPAPVPAPVPAPQTAVPVPADSPSLPGFLGGTTLNFGVDGFYSYNTNRPIGRVNLLRAYDALSNNFSVSQADVVVERAADLSAGRRLGLRLDLMFGQATDAAQGNAVNEPRPQVYRNIYQAYGTFVAPLGKGLTVDFGKFASSLGFEGTYTKDQFNYSRSMLFTELPFYHMGFRSTYNFSDKLTFSYCLVNGLNQSEDFNGLKSNMFLVSIKPNSRWTWNLNYHFGEENRDLVPLLNPGLPALPTQPGLSTAQIQPRPDGVEHIVDVTASFNATSKLTLAAEGDYILNRAFHYSAPQHVTGAAGYFRYQFVPQWALAGRFEYLSDQGGLFSGVTQALKDATLTATYQPMDGFQLRTEFRHDFSNQAFFLTDTPGLLKHEQNTATLGLIWWFGGKQGSW